MKHTAPDPARAFVAPTFFLWFTQVAVAIANQLVPVLAPELARALALDSAWLGVYSAITWATAALVALPAGQLADRLGGARVSVLSIVCALVALLLAATGHPFALAGTGMLIGAAWALQGPAGARVLIRIVPAKHRSFVFSVRQTGVQAGLMIASFLLPILALTLGWRTAALALALLLAACLAALRPLVSSVDALERGDAHASAAGRPSIRAGFERVLRTPGLRSIAVACFAYSGMQFCMNGFFVVYAVQELGFTLAAGAALLAAGQAAAIVGRLTWGYVADRVRGGAVRVMCLLGIGMVITGSVFGLFPRDGGATAAAVVAVAMGLTIGGWNGMLAAEVARRAPEMAGLVTGAVQFVGYAGLLLLPLTLSLVGAKWSFGAAWIVVSLLVSIAPIALWREAFRSSGR